MAEKKTTKKVEPVKKADSTKPKKNAPGITKKAGSLPPAEEVIVKKGKKASKPVEPKEPEDELEDLYVADLRSARPVGRPSNKDRIKQEYQDEQQLLLIADITDELKKRVKKAKTNELTSLLGTLLRDRVRQSDSEDDERIESMEVMAKFVLKRHKKAKEAEMLSKDNGTMEMAKHSKRKD